MKLILSKFLTFLVICLSLTSCNSEDIYHELNIEAKLFLNYEEDETFQLKDEISGKIITYTVTSKKMSFSKNRELDNIRLSFNNNLFEKGRISFTDNNNCDGAIVVRSKKDNRYDIFIDFSSCIPLYSFSNPKYIGSLTFNGVEYPDVYELNSLNSRLYHSSQNGILKIDTSDGKTIYSKVQ